MSAPQHITPAAFRPDDRELEVIAEIGADLDLSAEAVLRNALRLYQMVHERAKAGEAFQFSGDAQRAAEFVGAETPSSLTKRALDAASALAVCCMAQGCYSDDELSEMARATKPTFDAARAAIAKAVQS